ncbi:hypothetical protein [Streptomyces griseoflavus]|uniref:hypothetical protein n=1 Tax=Streptomyces griseoflavus TaxID=35619 RepID=UPI003D71C72B
MTSLQSKLGMRVASASTSRSPPTPPTPMAVKVLAEPAAVDHREERRAALAAR